MSQFSRVSPRTLKIVGWLACFVGAVNFTMTLPFMGLFLSKYLGVTENLGHLTAIAISVAFFVSMVTSPLWGALTDKVGPKQMALRSLFGLGLAYFLALFVSTPWAFMATRCLAGLSSGLIPANIVLVTRALPEGERAHYVAWQQSLMTLGGLVGPLLGGAMATVADLESVWWTSVLSSWGMGLLYWWLMPGGTGVDVSKKAHQASQAWRSLPYSQKEALLGLLVLALAMQALVMAAQPLLPFFVSEETHRLPYLQTGSLFSIVGIAGLFLAPKWANVASRRGSWYVLRVAMVGVVVLNIMQAFTDSIEGMLLVRFAIGIFSCAIFPMGVMALVEVGKPISSAKVLNWQWAFIQAGNLIGPLVGGALLGKASIPVLMGALTVMIVPSLLFLWLRDPAKNGQAHQAGEPLDVASDNPLSR